jgi:polygalacturonase
MKMIGWLVFAGLFLMPSDLFSQERVAATTEPLGTGGSAATEPTLTLVSPPSAQTAESIAIVWDKPAGTEARDYDVYLDGALVASTRDTDYTFEGLAPAREYAIFVRARGASGEILQSNTLQIATTARGAVFDVTKYGAVGDGKTSDTRSIQAAIDACSAGGVVRIPAGVFVCGAIFLKSEMTLHLDAGAVLLGSAETADYPLMKYRFEGRETTCYASLINTPPARGARWQDITVGGTGTIDANGSILRKKELKEAAGKPGRAICIRDTDGVYVQSVTVRQSPSWCVHLVYCNGVSINGVTINTRYDQAGRKYAGIVNGDGLDPDSCRSVFIFDCQVTSEDDCISLKSGRDAEGRAVGIPTQDVRISHCRFTSGFGVAMGSEMSGGLRDVVVEDCVFTNTYSLASVKAIRGRGGVVENITYRDCTYSNTDKETHDSRYSRGALYVDQFYGDTKFDAQKAEPKNESTPLIRNVLFQNITLDTVGGNAIYLSGLPESPLENIRLENVSAVGEHGFIANNIRGLVMNRVSVDARDGKGVRFVNVR